MSGMQLLRLAVVNIMITLLFIVFNMVMWYYFVDKGYEVEAVVLVSYYIIINVLNALNIYFGWLNNYPVERNISIGTKIFEVIFIGRMLWKRYLQ
jgi:hypothetical protein